MSDNRKSEKIGVKDAETDVEVQDYDSKMRDNFYEGLNNCINDIHRLITDIQETRAVGSVIGFPYSSLEKAASTVFGLLGDFDIPSYWVRAEARRWEKHDYNKHVDELKKREQEK